MNRLNYFNPYQSKVGGHEDQLTRAYLVLLKHSSNAFFLFLEYCRSRHSIAATEKAISMIELLEPPGWNIETQKENPDIRTQYLLSVLITDTQIAANEKNVESSERNARYDGVITFGDLLTMIIEVKPRSSNVWRGQLNPSKQNLPNETIVYCNPAILEWKDIIKQLALLANVHSISGAEKIMIEDFLAFVDANYPSLNPYDSFNQCKGNEELINRRINNILKAISLDEGKVHWHRGWGHYIQTVYPEIPKIGLILGQRGPDWWIELSLYFGDSQGQSIAFYSRKPELGHLKNSAWGFYPNFHLSYMSTNLVSFKSDDEDRYLEFWIESIKKIYQLKKESVPSYVKLLSEERIINLTKDKEEELEGKFYKTARPTLNVCPGFGLIYSFKSYELEELDKGDRLKTIISDKIREGLKVSGRDGHEILKQH